MPTVPVYNMEGNQVGEMALNEAVFGAEVNEPLLHQAAVMYAANQRQGTVATKTRSDVSGGGRKPWRQKGTGRARHGSTRSPIWVGGGTTFGPQPRDYRQGMPKKARRAALCSALSAKVSSGEFLVLEQINLPEAKTKHVAKMLTNLNAPKALLVSDQVSEELLLSARNIPGLAVKVASDINAMDILSVPKIIITKDGVAKVEEVLA
jgi:large subunit ribosomal protein L4